jgi:outer membrane lipoprotein LolB
MIRSTCLAGAALLLFGCAHTGPGDDDGLNARQRAARLNSISDWDMRGQLIVDTGNERQRATADWVQRGERLSLTVRRRIALGIGTVVISGDAERLVIESSRDEEPRVLDDPEADLYDELGWWLPISSLQHWLLGLEDPDYPAERSRGAAGTLASLNQRDWQVSYDTYQLAGGLLVPGEMTLRHAELELRLDISRWEPAADRP